ncbi:hypothetical protein C2845_PM13G18290 [Panicum miliaceum]|uniref:Glycosyltransferase 61 catalytic domain-containing protein n=1 Tax=Panicum miliaceum TaxID=4540 RepID=A0A3L6RGA2_PANMI|nr:hypothetical protein C2845_PM13G18290 [Panicum miliaceum]
MARKRNSITLQRRLRTAVRLLPLLVFAVLCYLQFRTLSRFSPAVPCDDSSRRAAVDDLVGRLRASVTFLPLQDTRKRAGEWFISALNDSSEPEGEAKNLVLPSAASSGRVLCVHAPPRSDAAGRGWRSSGCRAMPARWALFLHGAAVRTGTSGWLASLAEAATGAEMAVETFPDAADGPACFEEAVVFRRQMEGLSRARLLGAFDFMRCKARARCGVADAAPGAGPPALCVTLLLRTGARAFRDEAAVARVFEAECARVAGCAVTAARSSNLTFCDQVRLLSATDVLVTSHGAQLTNLLFMDRNSSVMEFYPLGWRQRAGGGQFVYRWMADRAGMRHEGSWWDSHGEPCPGSPDILSCYKNRQIGHDEAYFARWAARVFAAVKERKTRRGGEALGEERQREAADCGSS